MNVQDYKAAGFSFSTLIDQAVITRAENDVVAAYIVPLVGDVPTQEEREAEPLKTAIMSLAFLLVQQRSTTATRAGAKSKVSEQSITPTATDILRQNAPSCVRALCAIDPSKNPVDRCSDICGIFFKSNYFYNH